jgi:hypothetical protein
MPPTIGCQRAVHLHALSGQARRQLAARRGLLAELARQLARHTGQRVDLAIEEGQPLRLELLDHADLDLVDHRQAAALEARQQGLTFGVAGGWLAVVQHFAIAWVAFEHDPRTAAPALQAKWPGADRVLGDGVSVVLDHLARRAAQNAGIGQHVDQARPRLFELDLQGMRVECPQAGDRPVVVEAGLALHRGVANVLQTDDAELDHVLFERADVGRIDRALDRVNIVARLQLAALALERRVIGEEDAAGEADGPDAKVRRHLGQGRGRDRPDLGRPRQVVVAVQRFEDVRREGA